MQKSSKKAAKMAWRPSLNQVVKERWYSTVLDFAIAKNELNEE